MRANRFWIETVALSTATACALALVIAVLAAVTVAIVEYPAFGQTEASSAAPQHMFEGVITCSQCGAKHSAKVGETASDCTRMCVHAGASFALVDGDRMHPLEGHPALLKKFAGERVRVTGTLHGETIEVSSIAP